jgi:hypothetical protein
MYSSPQPSRSANASRDRLFSPEAEKGVTMVVNFDCYTFPLSTPYRGGKPGGKALQTEASAKVWGEYIRISN